MFKAWPKPPVRKLLYRSGGVSYILSHSLNVWPAPSASVLSDRLFQSASTYPVSGLVPGQDGDPRSLVLIITAVFSDHLVFQVCRLPFDC